MLLLFNIVNKKENYKMNNRKRKGARTIKEIPEDTLKQLNHGEIETANLVEWLAVDRTILLENVLLQCGRIKYLKPVLEHINNLKKKTVNTVNEAIGIGLLQQSNLYNDKELLSIITTNQSDIVRSWATFIIGKDSSLDIQVMLQKIIPYAKDKHFNVREEAWVAIRPKISQNLDESIKILAKWAICEDENLRRFACEVTRPRGVWCKHIEALKQNPELALSILEPLKSDKAKYVRDSLGNWLNDASKTQPDFVKTLCKRWEKESTTNETKYIIKKALRTIEKSNSIK